MSEGLFCRRGFLARVGAGSLAAATAARFAAQIVPASAVGRDGAVAPSNRVTLGFIGVGMMGRGHLRCFLQYPDAQVLAVCDVDRWRREDGKRTVEESYAAAQPAGRYRGCTAYQDLRPLLDRDDIDAVVVATGDRWHALASVMAAKTGKDVYCEKPASLTICEAQTMIRTMDRYQRVFQTGLQQRSTPEFIKACHLVRNGRLGKLKQVYVTFPGTSTHVSLPVEPVPEGLDWDLWLGPAPWRPFNSRYHIYGRPPHVVPWHFCRDFGGGNLTSNAVHAFDVVQWGLDMDHSGPVEIIPPETGQYPALTYRYANDVLLQVDQKLDRDKHFVPEGWDTNERIQNFGALFVGEEGWIHVGRQGYLKAHPAEILQETAGGQDPYQPVTNHHQNWLQSIRSRATPACDAATGCHSTIVAHLGCIAHWTGRRLQWDPVKEEFIGDAEANMMRFRSMRSPWRL